jgi:hypothetical protein
VRLKNAAGQDEQVIVIFDMKQFQDGGNNRQLTDATMSAPPAQMDLPGVSPSMGLSELLSQTTPPPVAEETPAEATE